MQVINTNVMSLNAQRNLSSNNSQLATSLERLSSGLRINSAKDDAAGLAISERFTAQIRGLNQAMRNTNDGISLAQTAEGAMVEVGNNLQRIRELSVQAANDSNSASDRASLQQEVSQLQSEIDRIALQTDFNGKKLLDGTFVSQQFQVGANANQTVSLTVGNARVTSIGSYQTASNTGAGTISDAVAAATSLPANNNVAAQTLTVSGTTGTTNVSVNAGDTARAVASSINAVTSSTGVEASARTTATLSGLSAAGNVSFNLYGSNSSAVAVTASVSSTSDLTSVADAINAKASSTGITATVSGGEVTLISEEGYDVGLENFSVDAVGAQTASFAGASGPAETLVEGVADSSVVGGSVTFNGDSTFTVSTDTGTSLINTSQAAALSDVGSIDIGTSAGANDALSVVDGALDLVNSLRAKMGAFMNRMESTIASTQTTVENLSSARSRIQDADFAQETASLTRAQILQQAGVAMLSQANSQPQQVLSLLR